MGDIFVFNSTNDTVSDKWKEDNALRKSSAAAGDAARKGLMDITNLQSKTRLSYGDDKSQSVSVSVANKYNIDQLHKENQALIKQIADRNESKIIELSQIELQKLTINLHKAQQQNWQLALTNSRMLAELNAGKDKLKELRHELGCIKGLLTVKNLQLQEKDHPVKCEVALNGTSEIQTKKPEEAEESTQAENYDTKRCGKQGRRRSKAACASEVHGATKEEKAESKRLCVRRQSARFKSEEPKSTEDLFEINEAEFSILCQPSINTQREDASVPSIASIDDKDVRRESTTGSGGIKRTSIGRPMRRATEKVQTYKEIPLNTKMRRPVSM